jgi:formamidopyrimidine-DNA glycosylase
VLFHARVHPEQPAKSLTHGQLAMVRDAMSMVVTVACEAGAISEKFPEDWLFHHRWGKVTGNKVGGKAISFIEVGGRTTAFVPSVQKKTSVNAKAPPVAKEKKIKQTAKRPAAAAAAAKTAAAKPAAKRPRRTRTAAIVKLACVF